MSEVRRYSALELRTWTDPPGGGIGVDPRSPYVDHFWVPAIGPVAVCMAQLLIRTVNRESAGLVVALTDLATRLGVGVGETGLAALGEALHALEAAAVVQLAEDGSVLVRSELPYLGPTELAHLPQTLRATHQASFALLTETPPGAVTTALAPSAPVLSLRATVDEILTNSDLKPRQLAYRWQHVVRLAEEARDESLTAWADPDLEIALLGCQTSSRAVLEAAWLAQHSIASRGRLPETCRAHLTDATAGVIDWLVNELPGPEPG